MSLQKIKEEIVKKLKVPVFPNRSFDVTSFGADENGKNDSTEAIQKAIDQAHQAGGGRVTVPEGVFLSGALRLKSNVDLHIAKGAVIKFSQNPEDYLPVVLTRFEGVELYNYQAVSAIRKLCACDFDDIDLHLAESVTDGQTLLRLCLIHALGSRLFLCQHPLRLARGCHDAKLGGTDF